MDQYLRIKLAFFHASELSDVENGLAWTPLGPQSPQANLQICKDTLVVSSKPVAKRSGT